MAKRWKDLRAEAVASGRLNEARLVQTREQLLAELACCERERARRETPPAGPEGTQ